MLRPYRARGVLLVTLLAAGCQDYNFNPVGHCLIQPGTRRVTLSNVSTADVLFVVDESGSMGGEQAALAQNFDAFIANLDQANVDRAAAGLDPIDFHLAVTTTSVFWNEVTSQTCRTDCRGTQGQPVCCTSAGEPARKPRSCSGPTAACPVAGTSCRLDCNRVQGAYHCCAPDGSFPAGALSELVTCSASRVGTACGTLETHYNFQGCSAPIVPGNEWPYPQGDFVSFFSAGTPNPRVLHFDKELYQNGVNLQGYTSEQLVSWFKQNVQVGTCGSGQEQALQAGRLALEKARGGQQKDTRNEAGAVVWTAPTATTLPTLAPARWPNPNSKIVLVFVGDEDDCSSPPDPAGGVVMFPERPGVDACSRDGLDSTEASIRNKQYAVQEFVSYFTSLGRSPSDVAAGFILPAAQNSCTLDTCTTSGLCCGPTGVCTDTTGAQAPGTRLLAAARGLAAAGVEVVAGSMCDPNFGTLLNDIAEIVKPPSGLELPTMPAENAVTLLRIARPSGETRKVCSRPAPGGLDVVAAQDAIDPATGRRYDWWFTVDGNPGGSVTVSQFVYINPKGTCVANPGETYSADYLGRLPAGGCWDNPQYAVVPGSETRGDAMCRAILGGEIGSWTCFTGAGPDPDTCAPGPVAQASPGTCICGGRTDNCRNDPPP